MTERTLSVGNHIINESPFSNKEWRYDIHFPKNLLGLTKRFERSLDVDGSLLFAQTKTNTMNKYLSKGLYPNVLMNELHIANEDYNYLKGLFKLD